MLRLQALGRLGRRTWVHGGGTQMWAWSSLGQLPATGAVVLYQVGDSCRLVCAS